MQDMLSEPTPLIFAGAFLHAISPVSARFRDLHRAAATDYFEWAALSIDAIECGPRW
jgi:hypothetical protein